MVFIVRGIKSATVLCTVCLYSCGGEGECGDEER